MYMYPKIVLEQMWHIYIMFWENGYINTSQWTTFCVACHDYTPYMSPCYNNDVENICKIDNACMKHYCM